MRTVMLFLLLCPCASAVPVRFRVLDTGDAPTSGVLVIVQNLQNHETEVLRALTDARGEAGSRELLPGLYRMIATTPYGIWEDVIKEFVVRYVPFEMALRVAPMPTHGYGDIVVVGTTWAELQVLQPDGQPAPNANVFVRDRKATLYTERWYKTDAQGRTKIEMISDKLVVLILYQDAMMTTSLSERNLPKVIRFSPD
jgi:hypothetical protein